MFLLFSMYVLGIHMAVKSWVSVTWVALLLWCLVS